MGYTAYRPLKVVHEERDLGILIKNVTSSMLMLQRLPIRSLE